jgi:hypothetical protein
MGKIRKRTCLGRKEDLPEGFYPVPNYNGYYCSKDGRIFSLRKSNPKELKGNPDKDGYLSVALQITANKRNYLRVHRIIASTFLGNSDLQVNHINGNKQDNRLENLEYTTQQENQSHRRKMEGHNVGICFAKKERKWRAYIQYNNVWEHLGFYSDKNEAKQAYLNRLNELNLTNKYAV